MYHCCFFSRFAGPSRETLCKIFRARIATSSRRRTARWRRSWCPGRDICMYIDRQIDIDRQILKREWYMDS